ELGSTCFVSVRRRPPPKDLLNLLQERFQREQIRFRKESEAVKVPVEGVLTHRLVDPASGDGARCYRFVQVERTSPERAVVQVETLGSGHEYTLLLEDDRWVVTQERLVWIA
ncbi:MAG: hypothetical protein ACRD2L_01170, partial [Terriglobia bacterium]